MSFLYLIIPVLVVYKFKNQILYNLLLAYDNIHKLNSNSSSTFSVICSETNIEKKINDINNFKLNNDNDILLLNFSYNNKKKQIILNNEFDNNIILASVNVYINDKKIQSDLEITNELKKFLFDNKSIFLSNTNKSKLLWTNIINNKNNLNLNYKKIDLEYTIMTLNIETYISDNLGIQINNGKLKIIKK